MPSEGPQSGGKSKWLHIHNYHNSLQLLYSQGKKVFLLLLSFAFIDMDINFINININFTHSYNIHLLAVTTFENM